MERLLVRETSERKPALLEQFAQTTVDGNLIDLDVFNHDSTFTLEAFGKGGVQGYAPIAQPLMIEHLIFRPDLTERYKAQAIVRLAEHTIEEAYRRGVGDIYFLGHDESTCRFAEGYGFVEMAKLDPPLRCYRMNLRETYGA